MGVIIGIQKRTNLRTGGVYWHEPKDKPKHWNHGQQHCQICISRHSLLPIQEMDYKKLVQQIPTNLVNLAKVSTSRVAKTRYAV